MPHQNSRRDRGSCSHPLQATSASSPSPSPSTPSTASWASPTPETASDSVEEMQEPVAMRTRSRKATGGSYTCNVPLASPPRPLPAPPILPAPSLSREPSAMPSEITEQVEAEPYNGPPLPQDPDVLRAPRLPPAATLQHPAATTPHQRFLSLAGLPTRLQPLPSRLNAPFLQLCSRMADAYLQHPSDSTLLEFLAIPKVAVQPGLLRKQTKEYWRQYPAVPWPDKRAAVSNPLSTNTGHKARRLVEQGRLRTAARVLCGESKVKEVDDAVMASLAAKHPQGNHNPFGNTAGPVSRLRIDEDMLLEALASFPSDTSPGISGWTVTLLKKAASAPSVRTLLLSLTRGIISGTCPGQSMLCAARLTPLEKKGGGIRPIAVGEMIYRLCTKTILKAATGDYLLPCQLGVKSKGGVEPIIRALEKAVDGTLDRPITWVTSLDFYNAFNEPEREGLAQTVSRYAPDLYRLVKWVYNTPSDLVVGCDTNQRLSSSRGVRQGDPLGPLLFSLIIRPLLEELQRFLGPNATTLAYLDDVYIFSELSDPLPQIQEFFQRQTTTLQLNLAKSQSFSIEEIKQNGLNLLGSSMGSQEAQKTFLAAKVARGEEKVKQLSNLPFQHAFLLLQQCYSQDLRHLQRSLGANGLEDQWEQWDDCILQESARLQGLQEAPTSQHLWATLPVRMGGLGLLSHREVADLAKAASNDESDRFLERIFTHLQPADDSESPRLLTQRQRCETVLLARRERQQAPLDDQERKSHLEAASKVGRAWLATIPFNSATTLSNTEVAASLRLRTLCNPSNPLCLRCGSPNSLLHDEVCSKRAHWKVLRHSGIQNALADGLKTLEDALIEVEPHSEANDRRRNDLRICARQLGPTLDLDIKVISLAAHHAHSTLITPRNRLPTSQTTSATAPATPSATNTLLTATSLSQIEKYLSATSRATSTRQPLITGTFEAFVMSGGGILSREAEKRLQSWKGAMDDAIMTRMIRRMSVALVRARGRVWDL